MVRVHRTPPWVCDFVLKEEWQDPAFPLAFPWFNTQHYWQDRILELREQIALIGRINHNLNTFADRA